MSVKSALYDSDFYAWSNQQAALLRAGELGNADLENIAEEIESMGRSEKRELASRLKVLLLHLLKWQFQPGRRGPSWQASIQVQRHDIAIHMRDNPSLKAKVQETIADAYYTAAIEAGVETGLLRSAFPAACPYSFGQMTDDVFWPD